MSMVQRVAAILGGLSGVLVAGGIVYTARQDPINIDADCSVGGQYCDFILELRSDSQKLIDGTNDSAQCAALINKPEDRTGPARRVYRALEEMREERRINGIPTRVIESWVALPIVEADVVRGCYVEVRATLLRRTLPNGTRVWDGQFPAIARHVNAADLESIVKAGHINRRPNYAKRSGCRGHVYAGEDPCAGSEDVLDAGYVEDPDGGT